jgi:drug/metabolite transporter (DMT)-like permease
MDAGSAVVGTGLVVALGHWSKDEPLSIRNFVGVGVLAIGMAFLGQSNQQFANQFGTLVFVAALFAYLIPITKKLGFTK